MFIVFVFSLFFRYEEVSRAKIHGVELGGQGDGQPHALPDWLDTPLLDAVF